MSAPLADRCECGYEDDLPPVQPRDVTADGEGQLAEYVCPDCGRRWFTSWLASAVDAA